jgi:hypothetical protein
MCIVVTNYADNIAPIFFSIMYRCCCCCWLLRYYSYHFPIVATTVPTKILQRSNVCNLLPQSLEQAIGVMVTAAIATESCLTLTTLCPIESSIKSLQLYNM